MSDKPKYHSLILENREKMLLSGVREVGSFNETEIIVYTEIGELRINGSELEVLSAQSGDMEITGKINNIFYSDNTEKVPNNIITKLFK